MECFNCGGGAAERYTLVLGSGKVIEDRPVCEECVSAFEEAERVEVRAEPVFTRGGEDGRE